MDTATFDAATLTLLGTIVGSMLTMIGLVFLQFNRLDKKIDTRFDTLDAKIDTKIDALDTKLTERLDVMGRDLVDVRERLARVEGHLMAPGDFTMRGLRPPAIDEPSSEDPDAQRHAG